MQCVAIWHLAPADAASLLCACAAHGGAATTVWYAKLEQLGVSCRARYGHPSAKTPAQWRRILESEHKYHGKVSCSGGAIMHGSNPSYWSPREPEDGSIFGE
eukprot:5967389-Prymnesium_polylepis.1